jgi:hypothetical protein
LPHNYLTALHDTSWRLAMQEEYDALMANNTWTLVPPLPAPTLSVENGSFATNTTLIDLLLVIKIDGWCVGSLNNLVSILMRRSVLL